MNWLFAFVLHLNILVLLLLSSQAAACWLFILAFLPKESGYSHCCHLLFKLIRLTRMVLLGTKKEMLTLTSVLSGSKGCLAVGEGRGRKRRTGDKTDEQLK